ncbi:peptide-methionine (R)-S-oxide reductase MsrB [Lysobacter korlensis]|uniref:peptide-methionine (R)-S-oxide reductase n=1 Tax=Lysobacter korlensis TaxID=553636 RepID=A0ABV6RSX0_9GAMM
MNRRNVLQGLASVAALSLFSGCSRAAPAAATATAAAAGTAVVPLKRPEAYWRDKVSPAAYAVLFEEDTERAGSSPLNAEKRDGTYVCAACHLPLFSSRNKFESGTGWPSFTQPIKGHMATKTDYKIVLPRTEYHCARCGGHQGHVFDDGPAPRGERWCNNGLALRFVPKGQSLPALRG